MSPARFSQPRRSTDMRQWLRTLSDARRVVRQQAACGYDFIKVHNILPERDLDAIADQAHALGMDLVGHVPHDITLDHALHVDRMRTTEHLKGFLIDQTLFPSDENYATALANTQTWITPTLYTRRGYERGDWARGILAGPLATYAPPQVRARWAELLAHPSERDLTLGPRFRTTQDIVMNGLCRCIRTGSPGRMRKGMLLTSWASRCSMNCICCSRKG